MEKGKEDRIGECVMIDVLNKIRAYLNVEGREDAEGEIDEIEEYGSEEDDEITDAMEYDDEEEAPPVRPKLVEGKNSKSSKVIPIRKDLEVTMHKPTSVEESRLVVDNLKAGKTVVLNLEEVRTPIAQRIVDFICGAAYDMEGNLQSISESIFIVTPPNVGLSGDFGDLLGMDSRRADASGYGAGL